VLAQPLIITLFLNENFTVNDVQQVTTSLRAYALGLLPFMAIKVFAPGYYSRQDTSTPVRIGIIAMAVNMVLNILLVFVLDMAHTGLALATSLAAFVNAALLFNGLRTKNIFWFQPGWLRFCVQLLLANVVMMSFVILYAGDWQSWLDLSDWMRVTEITVLCAGGVLLYASVLFLSGVRLRDFQRHS
jgi:putative peptidoglycan lipid II flippase